MQTLQANVLNDSIIHYQEGISCISWRDYEQVRLHHVMGHGKVHIQKTNEMRFFRHSQNRV